MMIVERVKNLNLYHEQKKVHRPYFYDGTVTRRHYLGTDCMDKERPGYPE
jgi:hypothetical protein